MVNYCHIRLLWSGLVVSYCHIRLLWSGVGGQLLSHQLAVVRGWWSTIVTSACCGQGLAVNYCHIMLLWSGVGGQLLSHHVAMVKGWWLAIDTFFRRTLSRSFREKSWRKTLLMVLFVKRKFLLPMHSLGAAARQKQADTQKIKNQYLCVLGPPAFAFSLPCWRDIGCDIAGAAAAAVATSVACEKTGRPLLMCLRVRGLFKF